MYFTFQGEVLPPVLGPAMIIAMMIFMMARVPRYSEIPSNPIWTMKNGAHRRLIKSRAD